MKQESSVSLCLNELSLLFQQENIHSSQSCNDKVLYCDFIKWLKDNGAIFDYCIKYPTAFGPLGIIGCKAINEIRPNNAMLFIPNRLIISSDHYKPNKNNKAKEKSILTNGMKLTLVLIEEYIKGNKSFWYPYISLILSMNYSSFPVNWNETQCNVLNNKGMLSDINDFNDEIEENYKVIESKYSNNSKNDVDSDKIISRELFKTFYLFTVSRLFYFTNKTSYLIPLADLLNHNPIADVKYEIFDSINYTMKYTADLDNDHIIKNLSSYTNCSMFFEANKSITMNNDNNDELYKPLNVNIYVDDQIELRQSDFFVISTNSNQSFKVNEEIYNNYGKSSNEYLLINFGFCLINNYYDFSKIQMRLPKGDKEYTDMITHLFHDYEEDEDCISYIVRIKKRKVNIKVIDYFRLNYLYANNLQCYPYTNESEIKVFNDVIDFYSDSILQDDKSIMDYIKDIKQYSNEGKHIEVNINIFKMTQKINLLYQKEYVVFLHKLCSNSKNSFLYRDTVEYYDNILNSYSFELAEKYIAVKAIQHYLMKWSLLDNK